ncbi:MAG: tRNA 2-thiouridine(34) synthase MnmA [Candidatus Margulisiibacteriota bacterium]
MSANFKKNKQKVLVAMSGGVDSSVAAALLQEQGYDLVGATMSLYCGSKAAESGCCSLNAARDAKLIADRLGFPHYTVNFKDDFQRLVIDDFINEYRQGRTPNPCIRCNQFIKFDLLLRKASELGAEFIATGHYARIAGNKLLKGKDAKKDQSYVLYRLTQEQLARIIFPLGEMTKAEVRRKAKSLGLEVADKPESQEICFVADDDYGRFIRERAPELVKPGEIIDRAGNVVGRHEGIAFYTIGQRKGLGHHRGAPKYVVGLDRERNAVIIGDDPETLRSELQARDLSFVAGHGPGGPLAVTAKIRYNSPEAAANLSPDGKVLFQKPQRAVTPGQSVVFYQGEEVIGGGIISEDQ